MQKILHVDMNRQISVIRIVYHRNQSIQLCVNKHI